MTIWSPLLLVTLAQAQDALPTAEGRLDAPGGSISAEDGAAAPWVNPALLGFDTDPSAGLWVQQGITNLDTRVAASTTAGGTALGMVVRADAEGRPYWAFTSGLAIRLPQNFRVGANFAWHIPESGGGFSAWDLGLGWRPLPWLGLGAVARNLGNPAPNKGAWATYGVSATLRPVDRFELSADYTAEDLVAAGGEGYRTTLSGILRVRPGRGVVLRARGDVDPVTGDWAVGGGLELYFDGLGVGAWVDDNAGSATAYVQTTVSEDSVTGPGKRIPVIALDAAYPYQPAAGLFAAPQESWLGLLERLRRAAEDRSVKGLVLEIEATPFSSAQIQELIDAIDAIQAQGKPVVAYLNGAPGNGAYALAATCDRVYLHPAGGLELVGLSSELFYLRGALDLVGVEPQYAKRAEYKSAPEQFTHTEGSESSREQMNALLDDLFATFVQNISVGRAIGEEQVITLIDGGPYTPSEALELGLVDGLLYPDELEDKLSDTFPENYELEDDYGALQDQSGWVSPKRVAIIYIDGPITGGESAPAGLLGGGNSGSATICRALAQAAEDSSVKAVVLRVDSPGGSAFASDEIWRAVEEVQAEGKPVVVSMGGVAASGGYYVAAGADAIFAQPNTITGSIGVYGGKFSVAELMETVGVNAEVYVRGRNAGMYALSRPMDPVEYAAFERMIADTYALFKARVGEGRGLSPEQVEEVARGRVWSGTDALEQGLVDELGGFEDAVARAEQLAGLGERDVVELVTFRGTETAWGDPVVDGVRAALQPELPIPEVLGMWAPYLALQDEHVLALWPYQLQVR